MPRIFAVAGWLWPLRTMRTASISNFNVHRALGLPIVPSAFTGFYTPSARDTFFEGKATLRMPRRYNQRGICFIM
ncbi:hypothetical protein BGLA2_2060003 [Burkholderia gladioli]|nr:hypothetical protein BGLA2_2060003 [Burkholderia gladioli]